MTDRCEVVVVGSGFAGSILARALARSGRRVMLIERGRHPRFALGESSTPLGAIALERLAKRYGMADLAQLAAYGRWLRARPGLRRGIKRGFTFFAHAAGEAYRNGPENDARLLVAASPDDEVADSHWLRADVDAHLVEQAVTAGVEYRDRTEIEGVEIDDRRVRLSGRARSRRGRETGGERANGAGSREARQAGESPDDPADRSGRPLAIEAEFVVDATGGSGLLARSLDLPSAIDRVPFTSRLVYGHFEGVRSFAEVAAEAGAALDRGPYPDDLAAVHHLTDLGWLYALRFDHGVTSAGFVLDERRAARHHASSTADPVALWQGLLARYPSLADQFRDSRPCLPPTVTGRIQRRLAAAAGPRWALLPHAYAFFDPLFSTGIAWSLVAVERLAELLGEGLPGPADLARYGRLLEREADHLTDLLAASYELFEDFSTFAAVAQLYFAAASYSEVSQRLLPAPEALGSWAWDGFLGAADPVLRDLFREARSRAAAAREDPRSAARLRRWVGPAIAPRNLAGLADPSRHNLYPVDLNALVAAAPLLGLEPAELDPLLPRLRGPAAGRPGTGGETTAGLLH